jgi:hypothetical protein
MSSIIVHNPSTGLSSALIHYDTSVRNARLLVPIVTNTSPMIHVSMIVSVDGVMRGIIVLNSRGEGWPLTVFHEFERHKWQVSKNLGL